MREKKKSKSIPVSVFRQLSKPTLIFMIFVSSLFSYGFYGIETVRVTGGYPVPISAVQENAPYDGDLSVIRKGFPISSLETRYVPDTGQGAYSVLETTISDRSTTVLVYNAFAMFSFVYVLLALLNEYKVRYAKR